MFNIIKMKLFFFSLSLIIFGCNTSSSELGNCTNVQTDENMKSCEIATLKKEKQNFTGIIEESHEELKFKIYFENGKIVKRQTFYHNGQLRVSVPIMCNSNHGLLMFYSDNNEFRSELPYVLGRRHGIGKTFYKNEKIQRQIEYVNDTIHGFVYEFSENGDTTLIEKYSKGEKLNITPK